MGNTNCRLFVLHIFFYSLFTFIIQSGYSQRPAPSFSKSDTTVSNAEEASEYADRNILQLKQKEEQQKQEEAIREKQRRAAEERAANNSFPSVTGILNLPPNAPSFMRDSLDSYIQRGMIQWQIPGLAIAVIKDGNVIFSKGYGIRELNRPEKVDENTLFFIASNTKLFTGTALALLEYEKKLSLNDKITKHLPWFRLYDTTSTRLATIRDMLCHRIGLKTFQGDFTFWNSTLPKDSIIWKMRFLQPQGEFRQDYGYCNSGYVVAGRILEKVSGVSWENFIEEKILSPLGMTQTYMNTSNLSLMKNIAQPHNNLYGPLTTLPFDKVDNMGPAASMVSNIKDLCKWVIMQLDSGRYNGTRVLPWEVLQKTRDINILISSRKSPYYPSHFRGYGLGVFSTDYNGKQVFWHTGGVFGHATNVCFVPEEKLGIIILTNNDNQNFFEALRYQLLDAWLGITYSDRSNLLWSYFRENKKAVDESLASLQARVDKKNPTPVKIDEYTGNYYNPVYGRISINKNAENLICHFQHHPEVFAILEYMDNDEFRLQYSNAGYGIHPAKFTMKNGKPYAVVIQCNSFVESDSYLFVKEPNQKIVK